jgi:uncharacterized protein YaaR (DUF327 family)
MRIEKIGDGEPVERPDFVKSLFAPALNEKVQNVPDATLRAEIGQLIVEVEERAKKLVASKGRKEFEDYKSSVKRFMQKIVNNSFRMEEKQGQKKDGKFVIYLMVQKVDEAVDHLGQLLLAGQQDSMRIVAALDEIRGMLFDMYL